jgi:glutathione synthase/RimK-type ligase-like ATP-grasp enzyme
MIIFYGRSDDPPLMRAIEEAQKTATEYLFLDQGCCSTYDLLLELGEPSPTGMLSAGGRTISLHSVRGVYARPLEPPTPHIDALERIRAQTFHEIFMEWIEVAEAVVVNRPRAMESNNSKPFQIQQIGAAGFDVPETLVTNDPDEARAFWTAHGRVIYKSISGIRSIVKELDGPAADRLERIRDLPTQFQAYVPGEDIRVHVVGTKTFATVIRSQAVDYRYAGRDGLEATLEIIELPQDILGRCVSLAERLCLPLCGIDLRRTPQGRWVCFEVNPMPAYTYFQDNSGLPISRAIVNLVSEETVATGG